MQHWKSLPSPNINSSFPAFERLFKSNKWICPTSESLKKPLFSLLGQPLTCLRSHPQVNRSLDSSVESNTKYWELNKKKHTMNWINDQEVFQISWILKVTDKKEIDITRILLRVVKIKIQIQNQNGSIWILEY